MNKREYEKAVKLMIEEQLPLDEIGISMSDIVTIKNLEHNVHSHYDPRIDKYVYYIAPYGDMAYIKISEISSEPQKLKLLEMSDIHCGSNKFDERRLRYFLKRAVDTGVDYVHIAGDLFDGYGVYRGQEKNLKYILEREQVDKLYSILLDYDLWYIVSIGNHDDSFCKSCGINPIEYLQRKMSGEGKKFTFLDSYEGNIIHYGAVFRLVHLNGNMSKSRSYKPQTYLGNVLKTSMNNVKLGGKTYNLRALLCGHFHIFYFINLAGVMTLMPGNFQHDGDLTKRMGITGSTGAVFTNIVIQNGKIIEHELIM